MSATIRKSQADTYRIRNQGEYACFAIECWERPTPRPEDPDGVSYAGELMINSSFGSFCNQWSSCGVPFRQFLLSLSMESFLEKCLGEMADEFDHDKSHKNIKRTVLKARRTKDLTKGEASDIFQLVNSLHQFQTKGEFVSAILHFDRFDTTSLYSEKERFEEIIELLGFNEPWNLTEECINRAGKRFWETFWPIFTEEIRREMEDPPEAPEAPSRERMSA